MNIHAQEQIKDTIYEDEDYVKDTSETSVDEDKNVLYFENNYDDTAQIILRNNATDSLKKISSLSVFHYPKEDEKKIRPKEKNYKASNFHIDTQLVNLIFWLVVIGFVVFIIAMYVRENNIKLFKRKTDFIDDKPVIDYNNIFDIDFDKEIANALHHKDYNLAARLGFLKILYRLNNASAINYSINKTNFDYQFHLINTKYYNAFIASAFCYDYAWYSGAVIKEEEYLKIKHQYSVLENLI